jgi:hypothetical protein
MNGPISTIKSRMVLHLAVVFGEVDTLSTILLLQGISHLRGNGSLMRKGLVRVVKNRASKIKRKEKKPRRARILLLIITLN